MIALIGETTSAPAVIPTNPANEPFRTIDKSGLLLIDHEHIIDPITPAAAAKVVVTNTNETPAGSAERTEPPLKPYHPNQSKNTPMETSGIL